MDSAQIAAFLEATYPDPPVRLTSERGQTIEEQFGSVVGGSLGAMMIPREMNILAPLCAGAFPADARGVSGV
jgi:glutathione S-transferase